VPDTVPRGVTGDWLGELRINDTDRHPTTLTVRAMGDSLTGEASADSGRITGTVTARTAGTALTFEFSFSYPEKHCGGTISGVGTQANAGGLLVGTLRVRSTCSDNPESGTFSFRRVKG
jgi:hypothetical protein